MVPLLPQGLSVLRLIAKLCCASAGTLTSYVGVAIATKTKGHTVCGCSVCFPAAAADAAAASAAPFGGASSLATFIFIPSEM